MLRISAFIAVLIGTAVGVSSAQAQSNSAAKDQFACYNSVTCVTQCNATGRRKCELWCKRQAVMKPLCR